MNSRDEQPPAGTTGDRHMPDLSTGAPHRTAVLLLAVTALLWSLNGALIKSLYAHGVGACTMASGRSLLAALALAPFALRHSVARVDRAWLAAAVVAFSGMTLTFVLATTMTTAANAIILQYTAPLWVFVFSPLLLGENADRRLIVVLGGVLVGVGVIFLSQFSTDAPGLLMGLTSGIVFGVQTVFFRRVRTVRPIVVAFACCAGSGLLLLGPAIVFDGVVPSGEAAGLLAVLGVVQFGIPYVLYSAGIGRVRAQEAILIVMLEPVLNPVWVWLHVGETPSAGTMFGGSIILASVIWLAYSGGGGRRNLRPFADSATNP